VRCSQGLLVSLINLSAQPDVVWNAPKQPSPALEGVRITFERTVDTAIFFASPDSTPALERLAPERRGRYDVVSLTPFSTWGLVWVQDPHSSMTP
jgi:hypothetical protein